MKVLYRPLALTTVVFFVIINVITLNDGHNWGDDFAQYILHANNILAHKPYASGISLDLRVTPPPGFPLLIAPAIHFFGVNFKILKLMNIFWWCLAAFAVYGIALRFLGAKEAALISLWFLTSPIFFLFKQNVLTDIPFMSFLLCAIWALVSSEEFKQKGAVDQSRVLLGISVFLMSYALIIRWAGLSLLVAVLAYYFITKREWQRPFCFIMGGLVAWFIAFQFGSLTFGYVDRVTVSLFQNALWISWANLSVTFQNILSLFVSWDDLFTRFLTLSNILAVNTVIAVLFLALTVLFVCRCCQRRISLLGCFCYLYLMGVVLWPINAGTRYLLPVMAPMVICVFMMAKPCWRNWLLVILSGLIVQNILCIAANFKFNDDALDAKEAVEMLQWVRLNVRPQDHYMFAKPRALALLTHRVGHNFGAYPQDVKNWYRRIKPLHIDYLIMDKDFKGFGRFNNFSLRIDNYDLYIKLVWKNALYSIYKVTFPAHE